MSTTFNIITYIDILSKKIFIFFEDAAQFILSRYGRSKTRSVDGVVQKIKKRAHHASKRVLRKHIPTTN